MKSFYFVCKERGDKYRITIDPMDDKNIIWINIRFSDTTLPLDHWSVFSDEIIVDGKIMWHNSRRYSEEFKKYAEKIIKNIIFI